MDEMLDLREQRKRRTGKAMLEHLARFILKPRFSAGVWYFYPGGGRFHERYGPQGSIKDLLDKVRGLYDKGVVGKDFKLEAHYPNEVNADNLDLYKGLER